MAKGGKRVGAGRKPGVKTKPIRVPVVHEQRAREFVKGMSMLRWTESNSDSLLLAKVSQKIADTMMESPFMHIRLRNGETISGCMKGGNVGNNAGEGGAWQYYGGLNLLLESGEILTLDYLDIDAVSACDDAQEMLQRFADRGLIQIDDHKH